MEKKPQKKRMDEATYSELIAYWFWYFQQNKDYEAYCASRRNGGYSTISSELERQFPGIAQLYDDWEDIYFFKDGTPIVSNADYLKWLIEHFRLFYLYESKVEVVSDTSQHVDLPGHLLINVTLTRHKTEVQKMLLDFIEKHYKSGDVEPAPIALYPLHDPTGRLSKETLRKIKKAFFISIIKEGGEKAYGLSGEKWTLNDTTLFFCEGKTRFDGIEFGWEISPEMLRQAADEKWPINQLGIENTRRQIIDHINDYKAFVHNTIYGKFPCRD